MKGTRFEVVASIQQTNERTDGNTGRRISRAFDSLYERCKSCGEAGRDYIE
jgi:hypothetical protein